MQLEHLLSEELADTYPIVTSAFLEFTPDAIPNAIDHCMEKGATIIKVLPYFLAAGVHVTRDIPNEISSVCQRNHSLNIEILPHIGSSKMITQLISSIVTKTDNSHGI
jgi:sirohydrochlorin ferrochelatase